MLSSASLQFYMSLAEVFANVAGGTDSHVVAASPSITNLSDGTGINKAQKAGRKVVPLTTVATDTDLTAFAGGINGANINFSLIKQIYFNNNDLVNTVIIGGTAGTPVNAWTNFINGTFTLGPGEWAVRSVPIVGIAVAAGNKLLRAAAVAGTANLEILIGGEGT